MPLYLTEDEVAGLLSTADALEAVEGSFRRLASGEVENVPRQRTRFEGGFLAVMWAVDRELGLAGLKSYAAGGEGASFVVLLFDVIGCGWQARSQVASIREALPGIERVVAYCRTEESLREFCRETGAEAGESHSDPAGQDVVVTVTTSRDPVLRGEWLQPGALFCAVGANDPRRRELDNVVLERAAFVCCDSVENARRESGDQIEPVEAGVLDWLEVHELQEVVAGELPGRQADDDIVVFKSNGLAAWDVAIGSVALERARAQGVGREL